MLQRQIFRAAARVAGTRGFAAAAPAARAPLKIQGPSGEYAHSLLDLALEEKADLTVVAANLASWKNILEVNSEMKRYLEDAEFSDVTKSEKLEEEVFAEYEMDGESIEAEITRDMIHVCCTESSMNIFPDIAEDFEALALDHLKEVPCMVTSAIPLTEAQENKVNDRLCQMVDSDQSVLVEYQVDESIVGGLTLRIGDKFQDLSVRSALVTAEAALRGM